MSNYEMFKFRRQQIEVFAVGQRSVFVDRMTRRLKREFTDCIERKSIDHNAEQFVNTCIESAACHGMDAEADIERFIEFSAVLGAGFDSGIGWASEAICRDDLDVSQRLDVIDQHLAFSRPLLTDTTSVAEEVQP